MMREVNVTKSELDKAIDLIKYAVQSGESFEVLVKFHPEQVKNITMEVSEELVPGITGDLEKVYSDYLGKLGFRAHLKGYRYTRRACIMIHDDPSYLNGITKRLYPELAREFNTTPSRVERAIRHSIETAWSIGDVEFIESLFGYSVKSSKGKPTNSEFLAMLADYIRLRRK